MMKELSLQDQRFLDAAEGWLGLGDHLAANEELEQITPELRATPKVLEVRLRIYWAAKKWEACVEIAGALVNLKPDNEQRLDRAVICPARTETNPRSI